MAVPEKTEKKSTASTVASSLSDSAKRGAATALAASLNQEIADFVMETLDLPDMPGIRTLARFAAPTLLIAISDAFPNVCMGQEAAVASVAKLANDANFRDLVEPRIPKLRSLLTRVAGVNLPKDVIDAEVVG